MTENQPTIACGAELTDENLSYHTCELDSGHTEPHACSDVACTRLWAVVLCDGKVFDGEEAKLCTRPARHAGECTRQCGHRRLFEDGFHWCELPFGHDGDHGDGRMAWLKHERMGRVQLVIAPRAFGKAEFMRSIVTDLAEIERKVSDDSQRLMDAVTAPACGARSVLGFTCDVPNTSPHDYHISTDPAYPAQPHQWRNMPAPARESLLLMARDARDSLQIVLDAAHERKRELTPETFEHDNVLHAIDKIQAAWAATAEAVTNLRAVNL